MIGATGSRTENFCLSAAYNEYNEFYRTTFLTNNPLIMKNIYNNEKFFKMRHYIYLLS